MRRSELERRQFSKQIHEHITKLLAGKVTRKDLMDELHVTKQAVSSYVRKRTTPKPHIVGRLLARWPCTVEFRGQEFGPGGFGGGSDPPKTPAPRQWKLFETLSAAKKDMRVEVERVPGSGTELRVIIKIAG